MLHPDEAWVLAQAESFVSRAREQGLPVGYVQHDRDTKFTKLFDAALRSRRVKVMKSAFCAPNTNAFVERFIQSIGQECLDRFIAFGTQHLDHLCREYLALYHEARPHQGIDNELIVRPKARGRPKAITVQLPTKSCRSPKCAARCGLVDF
jgi:putative transposase